MRRACLTRSLHDFYRTFLSSQILPSNKSGLEAVFAATKIQKMELTLRQKDCLHVMDFVNTLSIPKNVVVVVVVVDDDDVDDDVVVVVVFCFFSFFVFYFFKFHREGLAAVTLCECTSFLRASSCPGLGMSS